MKDIMLQSEHPHLEGKDDMKRISARWIMVLFLSSIFLACVCGTSEAKKKECQAFPAPNEGDPDELPTKSASAHLTIYPENSENSQYNESDLLVLVLEPKQTSDPFQWTSRCECYSFIGNSISERRETPGSAG